MITRKNNMKFEYIVVDCEFTSLNKDADLISCGIVFQDGSTIYYENNEYDQTKNSDFVRHEVVPKLYRTASILCDDYFSPSLLVASYYNQYQIRDFIKKYRDEHKIDYIIPIMDVGHYDMVHFLELLGGGNHCIKYGVSPAYIDLNTMLIQSYKINIIDAFNKDRILLLDDNDFDTLYSMVGIASHESPYFTKHNALYDACLESLIVSKLTNLKF